MKYINMITMANKLQKYMSPSIIGRGMGVGLLLLLSLLCGCSSDDDDPLKDTRPTFMTAERPNWKIDWSSNDDRPDWQEPDPTKFECSMDLVVFLDDDYLPYSSDNDMLAVFINDECRCVSYRNVMNDGGVTYLLHIKGSSEEVGKSMELRYYCENLHYMSIPHWSPLFEPNNLMASVYQLILRPEDGSKKYPHCTSVFIQHKNELPFVIDANDKLGIFSGDECVGVGEPDFYDESIWRIEAYSNDMTKPVQFRYYSVDMGGVYIFPMSITLNGNFIMVDVLF
jgi:hypothetical protein